MMESTISANNINSFIKKIDELVNIENKKKGGRTRCCCYSR